MKVFVVMQLGEAVELGVVVKMRVEMATGGWLFVPPVRRKRTRFGRRLRPPRLRRYQAGVSLKCPLAACLLCRPTKPLWSRRISPRLSRWRKQEEEAEAEGQREDGEGDGGEGEGEGEAEGGGKEKEEGQVEEQEGG